MMEQKQTWDDMAKLLWEEQVKEQLLELQDTLAQTDEPVWSQMITRLTEQLSQGQGQISKMTSMKHVSDCTWNNSALRLWEAQVKEQLLELDEMDKQ
ncbi:MAG: hypothetical protein AAF629_01070 [Chloroflexota bacterium]